VAKYFEISHSSLNELLERTGGTDACVTIVSNGPCPERVDHLIEEILIRNKSASVVLTILLLHEIVYQGSVGQAEALEGPRDGVSLSKTRSKETRPSDGQESRVTSRLQTPT